jgi:hypothetical protein
MAISISFWFGCSFPLPSWFFPLLVFSSPSGFIFILAFPMSRERGKPKRGPTYYSFVARHRRPGPSSALVLPPIPSISPVGPSLVSPLIKTGLTKTMP